MLSAIGFFISSLNLATSLPNIEYALYPSIMIFILVVPILTMRTISAEKGKTDQLLYTSPASVGKIVLGKWLATLAVFLIPMLVIAIYPLIFSAYGDVPMASGYGMIMGFFCLGATLIAIGIFMSSLTESQIIAAVLTFGMLILAYFMGSIISLISDSTSPAMTVITTVLGWFAPFDRLDSFSRGIFDISAIVYYITLSGLFIFLTVQSIEKRRWA